MSEDEGPGITRGWKYRVKNTKDEEFSGTFKGYTMVGSETAFMIEADSETVYIPISKIMCITLLEQGEKEPQERKKEEPGVYHG